jgi:nitrile hydratase beta subunit
MNGPHDMGGFAGFGPINAEADEPVFHEDWEPKAFALVLAMGMTGAWNIDIARHARERLPALTYWPASYYEMRFYALILQLLEQGLITAAENASGSMSAPPRSLPRVPKAAMIPGILAGGGPSSRPSRAASRFAIGDKVRTQNTNSEGHTRLPRYARGKSGEVVSEHGAHVFPDSSAHRLGDNPQWLYTVRFTAKELWGRANNDQVMLDLWEPYLEPA